MAEESLFSRRRSTRDAFACAGMTASRVGCRAPMATRLALAPTALLATALLGCSPHLVGTNDAALDYTIEAAPGHEAPAAGLVAVAFKERLSAAQITADVEETSDGVRVVVDADAASAVDQLATWRGGIGVYRLDDTFARSPADAPAPPNLDAEHIALS